MDDISHIALVYSKAECYSGYDLEWYETKHVNLFVSRTTSTLPFSGLSFVHSFNVLSRVWDLGKVDDWGDISAADKYFVLDSPVIWSRIQTSSSQICGQRIASHTRSTIDNAGWCLSTLSMNVPYIFTYVCHLRDRLRSGKVSDLRYGMGQQRWVKVNRMKLTS